MGIYRDRSSYEILYGQFWGCFSMYVRTKKMEGLASVSLCTYVHRDSIQFIYYIFLEPTVANGWFILRKGGCSDAEGTIWYFTICQI